MTAERLREIGQLLEACKDVDANDLDIEKSGIVAELVAEVAHRNGLDRLQHDGRA